MARRLRTAWSASTTATAAPGPGPTDGAPRSGTDPRSASSSPRKKLMDPSSDSQRDSWLALLLVREAVGAVRRELRRIFAREHGRERIQLRERLRGVLRGGQRQVEQAGVERGDELCRLRGELER